jgi:hypothetical protein
VALFLVFRDLPGITRDQYTAAQHATADATATISATGRQIAYRGGFFLPHTGQAICLFDAGTAADITAVNTLAGVPATGIAEAIDLRTATSQPSDLPDTSSTRRQTP